MNVAVKFKRVFLMTSSLSMNNTQEVGYRLS